MSRAHVVTSIRRNAREYVRVAWDQYEGTPYLDLRIFYEDGAELKPSKKGLTLKPHQLAEFVAALRSAEMMGRQLNLLPQEA